MMAAMEVDTDSNTNGLDIVIINNPTMQKVVDTTTAAAERSDPPMMWAVDVANYVLDAGMSIPSVDLGHTMAALCVSGSSLPTIRTLWSYLDHAMASHLVSSFHILGLLLSSKLISNRFLHPYVYSMFLELIATHVSSLGSTITIPCRDKVVNAVYEALQLSQSSGMNAKDLGTTLAHLILAIVCKLVVAISEDWKIFLDHSDKGDQLMQNQNIRESGLEALEVVDNDQIHKTNIIGAIEVTSKILQNRKTRFLLRLARRNLSDQWNMFTQCVRSLDGLACDTSLIAPKGVGEAVIQMIRSMQQGLHEEWDTSQLPVIKAIIGSSSCRGTFGSAFGTGRATAWIPIDIFMEDVMDGRRVPPTSVVDALAQLVKSLQVVLIASWEDTFIALWLSALRLVQRERDHMEGPRPQSESRFCMLLSIVPLALALLIEEEEKELMVGSSAAESAFVGSKDNKEQKAFGNRHAAFVSSLQTLGQFEGLLSPHQHVAAAACQAATTASLFIAGFAGGNISVEGLSASDGAAIRTVANLRHLIVETCISRGLLGTSAYYWPGYVRGLSGSLPLSASAQTSCWQAYMDGAPLTGSLKSSLLSTPAKSLAELNKVFEAALNGSDDERPAAASILCSASLIRGWNVQEHTVQFVLQLLMPPTSDSAVNGHRLIPHAPVLYAVLTAISSDDALHILSLYGMFPELAAALLPICEVFGALSPSIPLVTGSGEEVSVLSLFSSAFLILIKLWKFHRPPLEHTILGKGASLSSDWSLDYLLMRHNMQICSTLMPFEKADKDDQGSARRISTSSIFSQASRGFSSRNVTLDSFPKLKEWYLQHQSCIASTLSGLARGDPVHQVVDKLLAIMMRKSMKSASIPVTSITSTNNTGSDDTGGKLSLPAWDLLAAVPFVVDALLTACGLGKLPPRDLTTGLRELVDFFPASLASIASYLAAEVTRGLWKPASMNGTDWPNPSANLLSIEAEIRDMLAATGVTIPSSVTGCTAGSAPTLPLPLAALVSLTITFKFEKLTELVLGVAGPALQSAAAGSPWPSMPIVAALWAQKIRRWHDFMVFGSSQTVFKQDKNSVVQLLRSCFAFTLGSNSSLSRLAVHGGVGALLGYGNWIHAAPGGRHPVPPGILYLRICPCLHDILFLPREILAVLVNSVRDLALTRTAGVSSAGSQKSASRLRSSQPSLTLTLSRITQASSLAASLLVVSGGTTLAQLLFTETLPTWFLSGQQSTGKSASGKNGSISLLEGYAMSHFAVLSGILAWSLSESKEHSVQRKRAVCTHMAFLATALDGKVSLACEATTWKAYILGFVSLIVTFASHWIPDVKVDTLKRVAIALRMWRQQDLAAAFLEKGASATLSVSAELVLGD